MGEVTDDIIDGLCCEICGTYFTKAHGHPVICKSCAKDLPPADRKRYAIATHPEL